MMLFINRDENYTRAFCSSFKTSVKVPQNAAMLTMIRYMSMIMGIFLHYIYRNQICVEVFWQNYKTYIGDRPLIRKEILWSNGIGYIKS